MKKIALISAISLASLVAIAGEQLKFERSLEMSAERISAAEFDLGSGSFEVIGTSGDEIKIRATIKSDDYRDMDALQAAFEDDMLFSIDRQSEYAVVTAKRKEGMNLGWNKNIAIHLEVEVPKRLDLVVDDGSGSISIADIDGKVKIDDGSGSITLSNIGNDVEVDDSSGSIKIADVNGDVEIDDGSGSVELKNIAGTVEIEDGSGSITANVVAGDFKINDGSGDVVVKNLEGAFKLVDDGSGGIKVNGKRWGKK